MVSMVACWHNMKESSLLLTFSQIPYAFVYMYGSALFYKVVALSAILGG